MDISINGHGKKLIEVRTVVCGKRYCGIPDAENGEAMWQGPQILGNPCGNQRKKKCLGRESEQMSCWLQIILGKGVERAVNKKEANKGKWISYIHNLHTVY